MKKTIFVFLIALLASAHCFAQKMSPQVKALQGTWNLVAIINDEESYDEAGFKAEKIEISYIFKSNELTVRKNNETIGPVNFDAEDGFIKMGAGYEVKLSYNLQGNILILHENGYACIYRKR